MNDTPTPPMHITVIGTGYVGLSTGVSLALIGHQVTLLDIDAARIEKLRQGEAPFFEPGLAESLKLAAPHLSYTTDYAEALRGAEVAVIAVGTPSLASGQADLSYLMDATRQLAPHLHEQGPVIVVKSTVPVGTNRRLLDILQSTRPGLKLRLVSNPEFLRQGRALSDTLYPERVLIGGDDQADLDVLERLYRPLLDQSFAPPPSLPVPTPRPTPTLHRTTLESAELAKYAANAFLATKISFANEIANVCDAVGADIEDVVAVLGTDSRIGPHFLQAGLGYGGSCFPKDTQALAAMSRRNGYSFKLLSSVIEVNNAQRFRAIEKLEQALGSLQGRTITLLGLSFKPGTDDLRDAPSLDIAHELLVRRAQVRAHDPVALPLAARHLDPEVTLCQTVEEAVSGADAVLLVTEWPEYRQADWQDLKGRMKRPVVVDGRNTLPDLTPLGFTHLSIGKNKGPVPELSGS